MIAPGAFLPVTLDEARRGRGWDELDVVIATGDAYVDHPSFGPVLIARHLESLGYRVGLLPQPDWRSAEPFRALGRPRLFFGIGAGNLDSMAANRTGAGRRRAGDAYSPGGAPARRPDHAVVVYAQRAREAYPGVPIVLGGIEASLRRIAHYDHWSGTVRRAVLLDAKADLLVHGMGERAAAAIARRLEAGEPIASLRDIPGTALRLSSADTAAIERGGPAPGGIPAVLLPPFEEVARSPEAFVRMTAVIEAETHPHHGRPLLQRHGDEGVLVHPAAAPLAPAELDALYDLPFRGEPHPSTGGPVPAHRMVRHSITVLRGCPGGCAFCALSLHQGRAVQSRTVEGVRREAEALTRRPGFDGVVTDLGGPTANLYGSACRAPDPSACRRPSCLHPTACRHLDTDPAPLVEMMRAVRSVPGVRHAFVASGIRTDVAARYPEYVRELVAHHVGGQLSVAPEHVCADVLRRMRKPPIAAYERFAALFDRFAREDGRELHLVPYFLSGHPGCRLDHMVEAASWLRRRGIRPRQVQEFLPTPMTVATAAFHTGIDPATNEAVPVARGHRERRLQKALLLWWDPRHAEDARAALAEAGRSDLIARGGTGLVPPAARTERRRPSDRRRSGGSRPDGGKGGSKRGRSG